LTGLERSKLEQEYQELREKIEFLQRVLTKEEVLMGIIKEELKAIKNKYSDYRRTDIVAKEDEITAEDLIKNEQVSVTLTHSGYIKRMPLTVYRNQRRGGRGTIGINTKEEDFVETIYITSTLDYLICLTNKGKAYRLRVYEIPEAGRIARGTNMVNLLPLEQGEYVAAAIPTREFKKNQFLVMATRRGFVKRVPMEQFANIRSNGIKAITLAESDELVGVKQTQGEMDLMLASSSGYAIRFHEGGIRPMGRAARGVKGMKLAAGDKVIGMATADSGDEVVLITEKGYGKRVKLEEFSPQKRGGKGLKAVNISAKSGALKGFKIVSPEDELILITAAGVTIRQYVKDVSLQKRYSRGVVMIRLNEGDWVSGIARFKEETVIDD